MEANHENLFTPKWWYRATDQQVYGPHSSVEMDKWFRVGYFKENMPIRTKSEERFHTLGEWLRYTGGRSPFMYPVNSYEHLVSCAENVSSNIYQMLVALNRVPPPHAALMVASPPLPAGLQISGISTGAPGYLTTYQQAPLVVAPSMVGLSGPFSQPPSEPADEMPSSASNTPEDSDTGWVSQNSKGAHLLEKCVGTEDMPWNARSERGTDARLSFIRDTATQTVSRKISVAVASQLLHELFGLQIDEKQS